MFLEYVSGQIWIKNYPVHYAGCDFTARMTVLRLTDGLLMLHSPCDIDQATQIEIEAFGTVGYIVAPGSYHYFYIASAQSAFPHAKTYICPGIERKSRDLKFDGFLSSNAPDAWASEIDQILVRGNRLIWEIAFFHKASKTLLLVDLIENITDETPDVDWGLKLWWRVVFHMWNNPKPAPEYQMGWNDKSAAYESLERILDWDFERIIIAHGDTVENDAKELARHAWAKPLSARDNI